MLQALQVSMKYRCSECSNIFGSHDALCEDWRIPEKSLICPKCKHYLELVRNENLDTTKKFNRVAIGGLALAPVAFGFFYKFPDSIASKLLLIVCVLLLASARFYSHFVAINEESPAKTRSLGASNL